MFRRLFIDDWKVTLAIVLLVAVAAKVVFEAIVAWRMKHDEADRLARLPLEDDTGPRPPPPP